MPEHPEAPDRIWARMRWDVFKNPSWRESAPGSGPGPEPKGAAYVPYLRATPTRLAADQMLEALKEIVDSTSFPTREAERGKWPVDRDIVSHKAILAARAAIAAAQGEENGSDTH